MLLLLLLLPVDLDVRNLFPLPFAVSTRALLRSTIFVMGEWGERRSGKGDCSVLLPYVGENGWRLLLLLRPAGGDVTTETGVPLELVGVAAVSLDEALQVTTRAGTRYCDEPAGGGEPEA